MKTTKRFSFYFFLTLICVSSGSTAFAVGYPHYLQNGLLCTSCHDTFSTEPKLMPPWTSAQVPQDIDDTQFNKLCWSCHVESGSAPFVLTHSSKQADNGYGNWTVECRVCHEPHFQMQAKTYPDDFIAQGVSTGLTATTLTMSGSGWTENEFAGLILIPNKNFIDYSYKILSNTSDTITVDPGVPVGDPETMNMTYAQVSNTFAVSYGKLVRNQIDRSRISEYEDPDPPLGANISTRTGLGTVKLVRPTGPNSFADGDATFNGVCEVCHTQTNYHHFDGSADQGHNPGVKCGQCHSHTNGFLHGSGPGGVGCVECHGHDQGSPYDPDMAYPATTDQATSSNGTGSSWSHSTHTEFDADDKIGPQIYCNICHDIDNMPTFKNQDGSGMHTLEETNICDNCHSPGGSYNGVVSTGSSIGAKTNWHVGVYEADGEGNRVLKAGNEKWCAGCHDEEPSNAKWDGSGITAPNVIGDEDDVYDYGTGWGFYKTGHGLATGLYPASEAPAANRSCGDCHDTAAAHIDHEHRTYSVAGDNYQAGYRLQDIDGGEPMATPTPNYLSDNPFALCMSCHESAPYTDPSNFTTNFRDADTNAHTSHLASGTWDSDWDLVEENTSISCPACHNVHGSESPRMIRHGELISTHGTQDKVPTLSFRYVPVETPPLTLVESTGGRIDGSPDLYGNNICEMCHASYTYYRDPNDLYSPKIEAVYGTVGSDVLRVEFSKPVYTETGGLGALVAADFALTDVDNGRTVTAVTHTAGADFALLTLSTSLDAIDDIDVDTLAAATDTSIYANYGSVDKAMGTETVVITGDTTAPVISNLNPADSALDVSVDSNLTFTLTDEVGGINWPSFQIELTSDGYAETYTDLDTDIVTKTGTDNSYDVTVNPAVDFPKGQTIIVTVNVTDNLGNAMTTPSWFFVVEPDVLQETVILHPPSYYNSSNPPSITGGFDKNFFALSWYDGLRATDTSKLVVKKDGPGTFYVDIEDPAIGADATINSVSVHAFAKVGADNPGYTVNLGYQTGAAVIWRGSLSGSDQYEPLGLPAPTNSDGGDWTLADLNNLQVAFSRDYTDADIYTSVDEIYVVIHYTPWNTAPIVDAGSDQEISWPDNDTADLHGTVIDDGQPVAATLTWSQVSGPGTVTFVPDNAADTTATFTAPGTYVLQLEANDTELNDSDVVTVMVQDAVPAAPTIEIAEVLSADSIRWNFTDTADTETGFKVHDGSEQDMASSATKDLDSLEETGLAANTQYTRHVHAYNIKGNSDPSADATAYTLAAAPNVTTNKLVSTWYSTADVVFTNAAGFGAGGVEYYRYVWDQNATHAFDDTETQWNSGTLTVTANVEGSWYLHVKAYNGEDVTSGTQDYGPYNYDDSVPEASSLIPANGTPDAHVGTNLHFTLSDTGSGIDFSSFEIELSSDSYEATYTDADVNYVFKTGTPTSYDVTINPAADFPEGEVITVTVSVVDNLANALTPPAWSFTATSDTGAGTLGNCAPIVIPSYFSQWLYYTIDVPAGATDLTITTSGSIGDANLYVDFEQDPTETVNQCASATFDSNDESCEFTPPSAGLYHIGLANYAVNLTLEACYTAPPAENTAPGVSVGSDQEITWPTNSVTIDGTVDDDGLPIPPAAVTKTWSKVSGPGTVTFVPADSEDTTATFSEAGNYVLRLTADDGDLDSYDEVTITVQEAVPTAPTIETALALSTDSIRWNFTCTADNETGFKVHDATHQVKASAATPDLTFLDETTGLVANTQYTRHVHAYNGSGDSDGSGDATRYTLAAAPDVTADKPVLTWFNTTDIVFTNSAGFGAGGVEYYRYVWDQNAAHVFNDTEPMWNSSTLPTTVTTDGSWYLHVKAYNGEGVTSGTQNYGSFYYDGSAPSASSLNPANSATNISVDSNLTFTLSDTGSGVDWTTFEIQLIGDQTTSVTYTDLNTGNVSKTGTEASYSVTVNPTTDFANSENITVTVNVNDNAGNALTPPSWQFTTIAAVSNTAPIVDAGSNQTIITSTDTVTLGGSVTDDGLPNPPGTVNVTWSKVSGNGTVTFDPVNEENSTATFSPRGSYVLRLTADDGDLIGTDDITVQWGTLTNCIPVSDITASAGTEIRHSIYLPVGATDLTISTTGGSGDADLYTMFDQEPTDTLNQCASESGSNEESCDVPTPSEGLYHILVYAYEAISGVTLEACYTKTGNSAPVVNAGSEQIITWPTNNVSLDGSYVDDGLPDPPGAVTVTWSKVSGPGTVSFDPVDDEDTIAIFSEPGTYVLNLTADDTELNNAAEVNVYVMQETADSSIFRTYQIEPGSDDAAESKDTGAIINGQYQISLGYNEDNGQNQIAGFRFPNVDIPDGATIKSAHLRFFNRANYNSDGNIDLTISGEAVANSATFSTAPNNISDRTKTIAKTTWSPVSWGDDTIGPGDSGEEWSTKEIHKTADITSVVNEIIASGWTSGNAMTFFIEDEANSGNARVVHAYEHHEYSPEDYRMARLSIEFEAPAPVCTLMPDILTNETPYLPDYSYAGYKWGEEVIPSYNASSTGITYVDVTGYGVIPDDSNDDTTAINNLITAYQATPGTVVLHFPAGNYIVSDVITIERGNFVIQGEGSDDADGTSFQIDIPLSDPSVTITPDVQDVIDGGLTVVDGRVYSPYTYTGGFFYTRYDGDRYNKSVFTSVISGAQGDHTFIVDDVSGLSVNQVVNFEWANDASDSFADYLVEGDCDALGYGSCDTDDNYVSQPVTITAIDAVTKTITIKEPLMHSTDYGTARLRESHFLEEIGFEGFRVNFAYAEPQSHHFEDGYNAIFMCDVNNSWVRDVAVDNADSGIVIDHSKNSTVEDVSTIGRENHYNVMFARSYGMLAQDFSLYPDAEHNPSANTACELCVFKDGYVKVGALDQHNGLNHFNLFDNLRAGYAYNIFEHGGSDDLSPTSGIYNTFWNIELQELSYNNVAGSIDEAPGARVIGLYSNGNTLSIDYNPPAYTEGLNECLAVPSLYDYQLAERGVVIDTTAPILAEVTSVPTPTNDPTPDYTFNTDEAGTITYGGSCSSATTTAVVGDNTITFNTLADGTYSDCTITVTDASSNISNVLPVSAFTVNSSMEMFSMDSGMWIERHFDDPDDSQTYDHADMLQIEDDLTYGKKLAVGPFVSGEWSLRYDYNMIIDSTVLTVRGMYRTANLPAGVAQITVSYYDSLTFDNRLYQKVIPLGKSDDWTEFEVPIRIPYFDAVGIDIGFGLDAKSQGKAYFANLSYDTSVEPLAETGDINLTRPKVSDFSATGYVRVAESNGTWYFVDPSGKPFFAMGTVLPTWASGDDAAAQANFDLITSGKFNAGGGWSTYWRWAEANDNEAILDGRDPIYIFNTMESTSDYPLLLNANNEYTGDSDSHAFPDPYASTLGDNIRTDVENSLYITDESSWFVGFSPDNERSHADLWRYVYSDNTKPQFQAFLEDKYGTIAALNTDWGTAFSSFDNVITSKPDPVGKSGAMFDAFQEFAREIVRKYCQVTSSAIHTFDTEHLLISPQFMFSDYATWIDYLDIYAEYFDVIALNAYPENYEYGLAPNISMILDEVYEITGKPIIITEWSVPAQDSGLYTDPGNLHHSYAQLLATQTERANQTIKYIEEAFNKPYVIGYYWFKWEDYSNGNRGITKSDGTTMYDELWDAFTLVNTTITDYLTAE